MVHGQGRLTCPLGYGVQSYTVENDGESLRVNCERGSARLFGQSTVMRALDTCRKEMVGMFMANGSVVDRVDDEGRPVTTHPLPPIFVAQQPEAIESLVVDVVLGFGSVVAEAGRFYWSIANRVLYLVVDLILAAKTR